MIQTLDLNPLVDQVVGTFFHDKAPSSVTVVVPPGFGDLLVGTEILGRLRAGGLPVADVTMDEVPDAETFNERLAAGLERPYVRGSAGADIALRALLRGDRPALYVLRRFHCTLATLPSWMLACLRTAEEAGHARAIVLAPASLPRLKKRWEKQGHPLIASNYGDIHERHIVRLHESRMLEGRVPDGVPPHIHKLILAATGGYPEAYNHVLGIWYRGGASPRLVPKLREHLYQAASDSLLRLVEWLDDDGSTFFQDLTIDLHHGVARDDALEGLRHHELRNLLVEGDELRAAALGPAALRRQRDILLRVGDPGGRRRALERAKKLYVRGDYAAALQLLPENELRANAAAELMRLHARVMSILTDVEPGLDTDWSELQRAIVEVQRWLSRNTGVDETGELKRRHGELEQLSRTIHAVTTARVVDHLASPGPDGTFEPGAVRAALLLVTLHLECARRRRGAAEALRDGLALPEQLLRVWARWRLGLDYYRAPALDPIVVEAVQRAWKHNDNPLQFPDIGERFPSLWSFALYAGALMEHRGLGESGPEPTEGELAKALQFLVARNDPAHALSTAKQVLRKKYFDLCDRWLTSVYAAVPLEIGEVNRQDLMRILQPLPLLDGEVLDWAPSVDSRG